MRSKHVIHVVVDVFLHTNKFVHSISAGTLEMLGIKENIEGTRFKLYKIVES